MTLEEVKQKFVGMRGDVIITELDNSSIKRYVEAVVDENPRFRDEEYAKSIGHCALAAPPGFWGRSAKAGAGFPELMMDLIMSLMGAGYPALLDGGIEYEFFRIAHAGDSMICAPKIEDITEKTTKAGKTMAVATLINELFNQRGELVAREKVTFLCLAM